MQNKDDKIKGSPMLFELVDLNVSMMLDEHIKQLEAKILTWWTKNGKSKEFAEYFGIKEALHGEHKE